MRTVALAAAVFTAAGCTPTTAQPTPNAAASSPAAVSSPSAGPCAAAVALVEPYRDRVESAWLTGDDAAIRYQMRAIAKDADATFKSNVWKQAMAPCWAAHTGDPASRQDVAELHMWTVDVALASLGLTTEQADTVMRELLSKLDRALSIN